MDFKKGLENCVEKVLQLCRLERSYCQDSNVETPDVEPNIQTDPRERLRDMHYVVDLNEYVNLNKMSADLCFQEHKEVAGISYLVESHSTHLRQQIIQRCEKMKLKQGYKQTVLPTDSLYDNFNLDEGIWSGETLKYRLQELPEEWHVIQITEKYEPYKYRYTSLELPLCTYIRETPSIHLSILPTGKNAQDPLAVTLPKPRNNQNYDLMKKIGNTLYYLKSDLKRNYENGIEYWRVRESHNTEMKTAMEEVQRAWLKEWRVLFMADPIEQSHLVTDILDKLDKIIDGYTKKDEITPTKKWLLRRITLGSSYLSLMEIAKAIKFVLLDHVELGRQIIKFLHTNNKELKIIQNLKRKNVILIVDENLDHIPFEMISILKNQPVSRMPCLSLAYILFKEYEDSIVDGCKIIKANDEIGTFFVNPAGDLAGTEKRLKVFNDYWLNNWKGLYGCPPDEETFEKALLNHDILMYNGHGSGMEYLSGEQIEKIRVKANTLLFGCASASLRPLGGRYPPFGISNQYLIGRSPSVLGMLWAVTDSDIDRITVHFLSRWLKSKAKYPWSCVNQEAWVTGVLVFKQPIKDTIQTYEPEMLRAIATSRWASVQYMTSASIVIRGLPIKLIYE